MHEATVHNHGKGLQNSLLALAQALIHCHVKSQSVLQMFFPYKKRKEWRKSFREDRKGFNSSVWVAKHERVKSKRRKFSIHHELTTDRVEVSLLYSRVYARGKA